MTIIRVFLALLVLQLAAATSAFACDEYKGLSLEDIKAFRDKLSESGADPLDQLFAFQELVCSDNPTIRNYAVEYGLKGASDPIVREQVLLEALLQKTRVDIELVASSDASKDDKAFVKANAGIWSKPVTYVSRVEGCISIYYADACRADAVLYVRGDRVEFTYERILGEFTLAEDNTLVGYIRQHADERYGRIPAVIRLF